MVRDYSEQIEEIVWNVQGKVQEVRFEAGKPGPSVLQYEYDPMGNRLAKKKLYVDGPADIRSEGQYYVRDPQGNVLAVYQFNEADIAVVGDRDSLYLEELHLYGSSRLGILKKPLFLRFRNESGHTGGDEALAFRTLMGVAQSSYHQLELGRRRYELSNHLGNVLATVSDKSLGQDSSQTGQADYYLAQVSSASLYYPFGWEMPGRKFVSGEDYRFGFNGKEDDRDWGTQNIQDYGFRLYNPSIGKFLSVDPLSPDYPWYTPYQFAGNMPIKFIDLDGLEPATPRTLQTPALDNARVIIPSIYLKDQHVATHSQMEEHNAMYENLPPMDEPSTEGAHAVLDGVGFIPGFGEPADGLNGLIYTIEGRPVDASLSFAAMVPIIGWTATASKWTKNTVKYTNKVGGKSHDLVKESARAIKPKNQKSAGEIITITKVGSRLDALKVVEGQVGDLGKGAKPKLGKLKGQESRVTGMQSADETRGWRIDYDPEKGAHYNWWTEKEKGAVPFEGTERQVDQLIESLTNTYK